MTEISIKRNYHSKMKEFLREFCIFLYSYHFIQNEIRTVFSWIQKKIQHFGEEIIQNLLTGWDKLTCF